MYAGTQGHGLFRSSDGGRSWSPTVGLDHAIVGALALDPGDARVVYARTFRQGVRKSADGGTTRRTVLDEKQAIRAIALDPSAPATVYVAVQNGLYRSTDGGGTWTRTPGRFEALAVDPRHPGTVYVALDRDRVYRRTNDGGVWEPFGAETRPPNVSTMVVDPDDGTLYVGTIGGGVTVIPAH